MAAFSQRYIDRHPINISKVHLYKKKIHPTSTSILVAIFLFPPLSFLAQRQIHEVLPQILDARVGPPSLVGGLVDADLRPVLDAATRLALAGPLALVLSWYLAHGPVVLLGHGAVHRGGGGGAAVVGALPTAHRPPRGWGSRGWTDPHRRW